MNWLMFFFPDDVKELVLKIAILAEKNAPNFGWYVDALSLEAGWKPWLARHGVAQQCLEVVFKMLESAPDAADSSVVRHVK